MTADLAAPSAASRRSVLGRAFEILDCFAIDPEQTIASLCDQTGLPPATVHRMLANLIEWGAVERSSRGRYLLGRRLWRLGARVPDVRRLREIARPTLVDLHTATRAAVLLAARDDESMLVTDIIAGRTSHHLFTHQSRITDRDLAPWVVVAAFGSPDDSAAAQPQAIRGAVDLPRRQRVADTRRQGFAVSTKDGLAWVSAPVYDKDGSLRSTVSIVVSEGQLTLRPHGIAVVAAAREVSAGMGHRRSIALRAERVKASVG